MITSYINDFGKHETVYYNKDDISSILFNQKNRIIVMLKNTFGFGFSPSNQKDDSLEKLFLAIAKEKFQQE